MEVPKDHLLVQEEMMMPILPVVRVSDVDTAIGICPSGGAWKPPYGYDAL